MTQNNINSLGNYIAARTNQWTASEKSAGINVSSSDLIIPGNNSNYDPFNDSYAPWLSILAYNKGIINETDGVYSSAFAGSEASGDLTVDEDKSIDEYTFNIGGNISNMIYWGAAIGVIDMSYSIKTYYDEYYYQGYGPDGSNYMLDNYLDTRGTGLNVKLGLILRPTNSIRFGVAVHTPTWYNMTDEFGVVIDSDNISSSSAGVTNRNRIATYGYYDYKFQTPWKFQFSAAAVMGTVGLLSAEYELSNYGTSKYKDADGTDFGYEATNENISS